MAPLQLLGRVENMPMLVLEALLIQLLIVGIEPFIEKFVPVLGESFGHKFWQL